MFLYSLGCIEKNIKNWPNWHQWCLCWEKDFSIIVVSHLSSHFTTFSHTDLSSAAVRTGSFEQTVISCMLFIQSSSHPFPLLLWSSLSMYLHASLHPLFIHLSMFCLLSSPNLPPQGFRSASAPPSEVWQASAPPSEVYQTSAPPSEVWLASPPASNPPLPSRPLCFLLSLLLLLLRPLILQLVLPHSLARFWGVLSVHPVGPGGCLPHPLLHLCLSGLFLWPNNHMPIWPQSYRHAGGLPPAWSGPVWSGPQQLTV